jgi:endonuclease/exonuclease/phosphatase family metal-dependent hydrolase
MMRSAGNEVPEAADEHEHLPNGGSFESLGAPRLSPTRGAILSVAGLTWLLIELWRAWTPGLITIFGRAAETPPELIGAFALAVMGTPLVLLALTGRLLLSRPTAYLLATGVALAARTVIPYLEGGKPLLWTASLGVAAGVLALAIAHARLGAGIVPGVLAGIALAATTHAALGTWGAVWRTDWTEIIVFLLLLSLVVGGLLETRATAPTAAPTWLAWTTLPLLLLAGMALANAARAGVAIPGGATVVAAAAAAGAAHAILLPNPRRHRDLGAALLVAAAAVTMLPESTTDGIPGRLPSWTVAGFVVGMPAAALLLGGTSARAGVRKAPALAVGGGALLFTAMLFAVFAGYDLGYRADWVIVLVALVVALLAIWRGAETKPATRPTRRSILTALGAVVAAAVVAGLGPFATVRPLSDPAADPQSAPPAGTHRLMAWNLRMGYGINGTFRPAETARLIRDSGADIVLLSEIDRGWLLNGGQDQLRVLARLLDMHAVFGPAADQVWGDAVLSTHPLVDARGHAFPGYDSLTGAEALAVTVRAPGGDLRVISTHLQPDASGPDSTLRQARDLAALMTASRDLPTVAGGDLNTELSDRAWQVLLDPGYADALASGRPLLTSSSDHLEKEIDHLLFSPGLTASRPQAPRSLLSDHLPVLVDVTRD